MWSASLRPRASTSGMSTMVAFTWRIGRSYCGDAYIVIAHVCGFAASRSSPARSGVPAPSRRDMERS